MSKTRNTPKSNNDAVKRCRAKKKDEIEKAQKRGKFLSEIIGSEMLEIHVLFEEYKNLRDHNYQAESGYIDKINTKFSTLESELASFHQEIEEMERKKKELEEKYKTSNPVERNAE
ncbi:hypothetical protein FO519_003834 [Halicephalobus sp. NKZ332]|nr:hypothetical protein FO519_003834 [Halicephalobus sp. NKZ332]